MTDADLIARYNYDSFVPEKFMPWLNFAESPPLGVRGPDFPLWQLDGAQVQLSERLNEHVYTVVEFGSFT